MTNLGLFIFCLFNISYTQNILKQKEVFALLYFNSLISQVTEKAQQNEN